MSNKDHLKITFIDILSKIEKEYEMEDGELGRFTPEMLDEINKVL